LCPSLEAKRNYFLDVIYSQSPEENQPWRTTINPYSPKRTEQSKRPGKGQSYKALLLGTQKRHEKQGKARIGRTKAQTLKKPGGTRISIRDICKAKSLTEEAYASTLHPTEPSFAQQIEREKIK